MDLEDELATLKKALSAEPSKPAMSPHDTPKPDTREMPPEKWDGSRLRQEIDMLSAAPRQLVGGPRYELVLRALKAHGDESVDLLTTVLASELPATMKAVCAALLGGMDDARGVKPLLALWRSATDADLRRSVLRGLANLPGEEQTEALVGVWNDPAADALSRKLAIHGLARRRHRIAMEIAEGGAPGSTPALRGQALMTLHAGALRGEWKETSLLPVFAKALRTADGDAQRRIALLALEGFWSTDSVADLEAFADQSSVAVELLARARRDADAIKAGKPKPDGAGQGPSQKPGSAPDVQPADPDAPAPADPASSEKPQGER
jgi:hypothetical protein